jgi:hypothetical protein
VSPSLGPGPSETDRRALFRRPTRTGGNGDRRPLHWPFLGIVVLLVILIFLTPNLLGAGKGPAAGSLPTEARLIVDRPPVGNATILYVESIGTSTRYQAIDIGVIGGVPWPFPGTGANLTGWTWSNASQVLVAKASATASSIAVNVTVRYTDPANVTVFYVGLYIFHLNGTAQLFEAVGLLPGLTPPATTPVRDLPIYLLLRETSTLQGVS